MLSKRQSTGTAQPSKGKWLDDDLSDVEEEDSEVETDSEEEEEEEEEEETESEEDEDSEDEDSEDEDSEDEDSDDEDRTISITTRLSNSAAYCYSGVKSVFNLSGKFYQFGKAVSIELLCVTAFLAFPLIVARNSAYKEVMTKYVVKNHGEELKTARTVDFLNLD